MYSTNPHLKMFYCTSLRTLSLFFKKTGRKYSNIHGKESSYNYKNRKGIPTPFDNSTWILIP